MKRKTDNFNKFYNKKNNAAIKEGFKQEKKAAKKERKEAIERHFEERRQARGFSPNNNTDKGPQRFNRPHPGIPAKGPAGKGPIGKSPVAAGPAKGPFGKDQTTKGPVAKGPIAKGQVAKGPAEKTAAGAQTHTANTGDQLPLNKYIAHGGICSRRDAAELIRQGKVSVNGKPVTEPGTKVVPTDLVKVNGKKVTISKNFVYILLNKPKDYLTTMDDPQGRRTVLDLIRAATTERVFPVGRLDRNTSGVLLLTNDGDLSQKLAHPSHEIKKVYHVTLDKALTKGDFDKVVNGVTLEDGPAHVDVMAYADPKDRTQIGLEIHSGRNRIVRRIFEHLGYDVRGLDRVMYAGLTKKNVQRGKWRFLTEKEVRILKYLNSSIKGSAARAKDWAAAENIAAAEKAPAKAKAPVETRAAAPQPPARTAEKKAADRAEKPASHFDKRPSRKPHSASKPFGAGKPTNRAAASRPTGRPASSKPALRPRKPKFRPDAE